MPHVLIVEDDAAIADTLVSALRGEGLETAWVSLGVEALEHQKSSPADLVILDMDLPDSSGFEVFGNLRRFSGVPVIFLTAPSGETDRVVGLESGADEYLIKPFNPRDVAARARAMLKRVAPRQAMERGAPLFQVNNDRVQISYRGTPLTLTRHEFRLLNCLLKQPERVFSREHLLHALGVANDAGDQRSIDSHIKGLRAKLRLVRAEAEPIQTHRGLGYSYSPGRS